MPARFCMLASGSSGNCAYLHTGRGAVLIDAGLGPRLLSRRLAAVGATWKDVRAVLLTHTHSDHWKDPTLGCLRQHNVPLYCAAEHHPIIERYSPGFADLKAAGLVRPVEAGVPIELGPGVTGLPIGVPHDASPTFGYRIDGPPALFGPSWSIGYAADLGVVRPDLIDAFANVSLLALEFNHCEDLERSSGRPQYLIERVLGDWGHLSNRQAGEAVARILSASAPGSLRHLVQLHLSRDCNRVGLASAAGRSALTAAGCNALLTTATQDRPTGILNLEGAARRSRAATV